MSRKNPWLEIPAADYEGHMGREDVDQLTFLSESFRQSLESCDSTSVALLGCATGNGLEHVINNGKTRKVTAVDINPEYLEILGERFGKSIEGLEIVNADLEKWGFPESGYTLVFAGLVFEYLNTGLMLSRISGSLCRGGVLSAVLQLPCGNNKKISETPFKSLKLLDPLMELVDPDYFRSEARKAGLDSVNEKTITLHTGKSFYTGYFRKS